MEGFGGHIRFRVALGVMIFAALIALAMAAQALAQDTNPRACLSELDASSAASLRACADDLAATANELENQAQAVMRRAVSLRDSLDAAPPAEPPTPPVEDPAPPTGSGLTIDGLPVTPTPLDTITTETGVWPVESLGEVEEGKAYLFRLQSRPEWWSLCIARVPYAKGTAEWAGATVPAFAERPYAVSVGDASFTLAVAPGAFRCADNGEPVTPSMERVRKAVADKRVLPYGAAAFAGWPYAPKWELKLPGAYTEYHADRINGRDASHSVIGTISAQGGEYSSSRGFLSGEDALMIAAALKGDQALFDEVAAVNRTQMLYGLSLDEFAIWSSANDLLMDPQIPLAGDGPYAVGTQPDQDHWGGVTYWCAPAAYKYLASIGATAGTCYRSSRNGEHLFNHGFAYWLATGDPRAALLQETIAAYALSAPYHGANADGTYRIQFGYQRWTLNIFTAMWKLRDVALHASTANGTILWPQERAQKMWTDILADWKRQLAELDASDTPKWQEMSALHGYDATPTIFSNFMTQAYGPEAAYLWASAGDGALLSRIATHMVWRVNALGGTLGMMGEKGSTFIDIDGAATTLDAIEAHVRAAQPDRPTTNFDDSPYHYTLRAYWLLKMAKDAVGRGWIAPIDGLDAAIANMETERDATTDWRSQGVLGWKHSGGTFEWLNASTSAATIAPADQASVAN